MQKKENFLTKFVKKDYNNKLEEVLSKKDFEEDVKNTLLSMFYKIENGYKDYKTVKQETFEKTEYIEKMINIIRDDCLKIVFNKINSKEEEIVDRENKTIVCLPIESKLLYCLAKIQKRTIVVNYIDKDIEEALSFMLNTGNNINIVEPLRDFNGFSWNIIEQDIEDLNYNLLYQNIIFLIGNKFTDKWVNNYEPLVDYFDLFQSEIERKYGKKNKENIITNLIRISLYLKAFYDEEFKKRILDKAKTLEDEMQKVDNKEEYLEDISKEKKKIEKEIKNIDKIINNKDLIIEEYEKRNEKLPLEKKIFSIRVLKEILKQERSEKLAKLEECNTLMKPKNFIKYKEFVSQKVKYFKDIQNLDIKEEMINLQKQIIKCMYLDLKNIEDKSQMIKFIYMYRYYNYLILEKEKNIHEEKKLEKSLKKLKTEMISKAINMKAIIKIAKEDEINLKITEYLLLSKIIKLEDINLEINKEKDDLFLTIYDEEIEDNRLKINDVENIKGLNLKNKKKTKLFI